MRWRSLCAIALCFAAWMGCIPAIAAPLEDKEGESKDPAKVAKAEGKVVLVPVWKKTTIGYSRADDPVYFEDFKDAGDWLAKRYSAALAERQKSGRSMIPPATPVGVGDLVAVTNDRSVATFALRKSKYVDISIESGELAWTSERDGELAQMVKHLGPRTMTEIWLKDHSSESIAEMLFNRTQNCSPSRSITDTFTSLMTWEFYLRRRSCVDPCCLEECFKNNCLQIP